MTPGVALSWHYASVCAGDGTTRLAMGMHKQQEQLHTPAMMLQAWLQQLVDIYRRPAAADQLDDKMLDLMLSIRGYGHVKEQILPDAALSAN
jgi:hypothetical protein